MTDKLFYSGNDLDLSILKLNSNVNYPELEIARIDYEIADGNSTYIKTRPYITFGITGTYNAQNSKSVSMGLDSTYKVSLTGSIPIRTDLPIYYSDNYIFGIQCSYEFYDGKKRKEDIKYALTQSKIKKNDIDILKNELIEKINSNKVSVKNAANRVNTLYKVFKVSLSNVNAANIKYIEGKISLFELLNIESDSVTAHRKYFEALYDVNVELERYKKDLLLEEYQNEL